MRDYAREVVTLGLVDKICALFAEEESWKRKDPVTHQGKVYGAWIPEEDPCAAWPNAKCAKCGGITLKKELYWNRDSNSWYHFKCLAG